MYSFKWFIDKWGCCYLTLLNFNGQWRWKWLMVSSWCFGFKKTTFTQISQQALQWWSIIWQIVTCFKFLLLSAIQGFCCCVLLLLILESEKYSKSEIIWNTQNYDGRDDDDDAVASSNVSRLFLFFSDENTITVFTPYTVKVTWELIKLWSVNKLGARLTDSPGLRDHDYLTHKLRSF